ncbi:hypothetical protein SAMN04489720_0805 [Agrococcus jejuensis]|uniref:DUF4935 domain-containing protein n=2 Tax=Agrococcus jejuensis TaxID=399736 RepID=A0A1G8BAD7_9MICO|nr:hypothetical protein SAMN04489720_0805 [Agrococcus jejuensis]
MSKASSKKFLEALLQDRVEVVLSPVVVAEARRRAERDGKEVLDAVQKALSDLRRKYEVPTGVQSLLDPLLGHVEKASRDALRPLLEHAACKVQAWPKTSSQELVVRELEQRRPTALKGTQTIGLRDTIIWHGLLDLLRSVSEHDEVLFVTADGAFLEGEELAASLISEIDDVLGNPEQLIVKTRLEHATVMAEERLDLLTRQEASMRRAVIDHLSSFDGMRWSDVDISGEAPMRFGIEEGQVVAVDSIAIEGVVDPTSPRVEATAEISISGYMRSEEFLLDNASEVDWVNGDLDDPMIEVDFTSTVQFEAEVVLDGDEAWIDDETLHWVD